LTGRAQVREWLGAQVPNRRCLSGCRELEHPAVIELAALRAGEAAPQERLCRVVGSVRRNRQ